MCKFIGIESVTANALIELLEKRNEREVSFDMLVRYGTRVARVLEESFNEEPVLLLSRKYQINMIENYSDFFEADLSSERQEVFFRLKGEDKQKTIEELTKSFHLCGCNSMACLHAIYCNAGHWIGTGGIFFRRFSRPISVTKNYNCTFHFDLGTVVK